jgi:hypothetical protein
VLETLPTSEGVGIRATVRRMGVYLDNWAIIELAKGDRARRDRVIHAIRSGADLMFSPTNAAEILAPDYASSVDEVKAFLDAIGPCWFPIEGPDVQAVMRREDDGEGVNSCTSTWFINLFSAAHNLALYGEQRLEMVGPEFFRLGFVLEWLDSQRQSVREKLAHFDQQLFAHFKSLQSAPPDVVRVRLDQIMPRRSFDPARPATFAWAGLLRMLVLEARGFQLKKGDIPDLCHAVMGAAYARFAALDKQWKRRVENLPKPNDLAIVYCRPELDQLAQDLQRAIGP